MSGFVDSNCKVVCRLGDYKLLQGKTGNHNGWYPVPGVDDPPVTEDEEKPPKKGYQLFNIRGTLLLFSCL